MRLVDILNEFNSALTDLAGDWRNCQTGFVDKKIEKFGVELLRPISNGGQKVNSEANDLQRTMNKLKEKGLIEKF